MNTVRTILNKSVFSKTIHWKLLLFLLLFLDVKLVVKLAALLLIYVLQPEFRFGLRQKPLQLSFFYLLMILLALLNTLFHGQLFQVNYLIVLLFGIGIWMACFLSSHQLRRIVETTDPRIIYNTLVAFFLLNAFASAIQFLLIVWETGAINPFRYQGNYQKYFISTGDYIKGISFDTSTTNAILNAFGMIFFLYKRNWLMLLLCTCILLLTGSNLVNILVYLTLFVLFLVHSSREQKSFVVICIAMLVIFMVKVSPQNNDYALNVLEKAFQLPAEKKKAQEKPVDVRTLPEESLSPEQHKEKIALLYLDSLRSAIAKRVEKLHTDTALVAAVSAPKEKPFIPQPSIHSAPFQNRDDTNAYRRELLSFNATKPAYKEEDSAYAHAKLPGKVLALLQTKDYFQQHPLQIVTGTGLGNFSSKMAFKATALKFAGGFPQPYAYINPFFSNNHLSLYTFFFSKRANAHSITNSPNNVYDQLLSEYGIIGLAGFFFFYIGFFARYRKKLTYGIPLLFLLLAVFFIDYWFEQLSIVVLFELLLFLNIKETGQA
jgi:hypothetical protein